MSFGGRCLNCGRPLRTCGHLESVYRRICDLSWHGRCWITKRRGAASYSRQAQGFILNSRGAIQQWALFDARLGEPSTMKLVSECAP